jgi:hypothetical protein
MDFGVSDVPCESESEVKEEGKEDMDMDMDMDMDVNVDVDWMIQRGVDIPTNYFDQQKAM